MSDGRKISPRLSRPESLHTRKRKRNAEAGVVEELQRVITSMTEQMQHTRSQLCADCSQRIPFDGDEPAKPKAHFPSTSASSPAVRFLSDRLESQGSAESSLFPAASSARLAPRGDGAESRSLSHARKAKTLFANFLPAPAKTKRSLSGDSEPLPRAESPPLSHSWGERSEKSKANQFVQVKRQSSHNPAPRRESRERRGGSAIQLGSSRDSMSGEEGGPWPTALGRRHSQPRKEKPLTLSIDPEAECEVGAHKDDDDDSAPGSPCLPSSSQGVSQSPQYLLSVSPVSSFDHPSTPTHSGAMLDRSALLYKLRLARDAIEEKDSSRALQCLRTMEEEILATFSGYCPHADSEEAASEFLMGEEEDEEEEDDDEEDKEPPYQEVRVRVDQSSLLNTGGPENSPTPPTPESSPKLVIRHKPRSHSTANENLFEPSLSPSLGPRRSSSTTDDLDKERYLTFCQYPDGRRVLKHGHILDILEWLVNTQASTSDMETFLFSYRKATTPTILLDTLTVLYRFSLDPNRSQQIVRMLNLWVKKFYGVDFVRNEPLASKLWKFVQTNTPSQYKSMRRAMNSWYNQYWTQQRRLPMTVGNFESASLSLDLAEQEPRAIAEQITAMEWEFFQHFSVLDCICDDKPDSHASHLLVEQFNRISGWVARMVLSSSRAKRRATMICFFIQVAHHLYKLQNFNAIVEITAGLDSTAIGRLKRTWRCVQENYKEAYKELKQLNRLVSPRENFKNYRAMLASVQPPCVPFFGVISRDATLINVGNATFLSARSLFNFEKCVILWSKLGKELMALQRKPFSIPMNLSLRAALQTLPVEDEHTLYQRSVQLEPIGTH